MLDTVIYGTYTIKDILPFVIGIIALWIFWKITQSLFKTDEVSEHRQTVRCPGCGWQGQVSRYAGRCPQCNEPLGDRKAKPLS